MSDKPVSPQIDNNGMVRADGVVIGRLVPTQSGVALQVCDKDKRRSSERGTRFVLVDLAPLVDKKTPPDDTPGDDR